MKQSKANRLRRKVISPINLFTTTFYECIKSDYYHIIRPYYVNILTIIFHIGLTCLLNIYYQDLHETRHLQEIA